MGRWDGGETHVCRINLKCGPRERDYVREGEFFFERLGVRPDAFYPWQRLPLETRGNFPRGQRNLFVDLPRL